MPATHSRLAGHVGIPQLGVLGGAGEKLLEASSQAKQTPAFSGELGMRGLQALVPQILFHGSQLTVSNPVLLRMARRSRSERRRFSTSSSDAGQTVRAVESVSALGTIPG